MKIEGSPVVFDLPNNDEEFVAAYIEVMVLHLRHFSTDILIRQFGIVLEQLKQLEGNKIMSSPFDMPDARHSWEERGGWVLGSLMVDLGLVMNASGGIVGNTGFESIGFTKLHEIGQPEGLGGYGWGQWTADRRRSFFAFCKSVNLDWHLDEANYRYLVHELKGAYRRTVDALKAMGENITLEQAVWSVGQTYERPGGTTPDNLPGYTGRLKYAQRAVNGYKGLGTAVVPSIVVDVRDAQQRLNDWGIEPELDVDGIVGPDTRDAIRVFQELVKIPITGIFDDLTLQTLKAQTS